MILATRQLDMEPGAAVVLILILMLILPLSFAASELRSCGVDFDVDVAVELRSFGASELRS